MEVNTLTNETIIIRSLPLSSWFPYDEQKYYVASYCWQLIDGCLASAFVTYTDCLLFSLIIFPLGQISILNHTLVNFSSEYVNKLMKQNDLPLEERNRLVFRKCVIVHQNIIRWGFQEYIQIYYMFTKFCNIQIIQVSTNFRFLNFIERVAESFTSVLLGLIFLWKCIVLLSCGECCMISIFWIEIFVLNFSFCTYFTKLHEPIFPLYNDVKQILNVKQNTKQGFIAFNWIKRRQKI